MKTIEMRFIYMALAISLYSTLSGQVTADFSANQTEACEVLSANFLDESTSSAGPIVDWQWTIGSITSTNQNPSSIFNVVGEYEVCLTATDDQGNEDTECKEAFIKIYKNPTANFSVDDNGICAPATIGFNDLSVSDNGDITNWTWDVGGSTGVLITSDPNEEISSTYNIAGLYSVTLQIEDEKGCKSIESKSAFVEVLRNPDPSFTAVQLSDCELPAIVEIDFTEDIAPATYTWDFGNGETYTGVNPPDVVYESDGKYEITLTANDGNCETILIQEVNISTNPELDIEVLTDFNCVGKEVFLDLEDIDYDSILWNVESVDTFTTTGVVGISFSEEGCFEVSGIVYSGNCTYAFVNPNCIEVQGGPDLTIFPELEEGCKLPVNLNLSYDSDTEGGSYWKVTDPNGVVYTEQGRSIDYTCTVAGTYNIRFTLSVDKCFFSYEENITVDNFEVLLPFEGPSGCIPLEVTLTDSIVSQFDISSYQWKVEGDNFSYESMQASPTFTITEVGSYDLSLIATNDQGCMDTVVIEDYIGAGTPPDVDFTYSPLEACANKLFSFIDQSSSEANDWYWQIPDGGDFFTQDLNYSFRDTGYFNVTHIAYFNGCPSDTMTVTDAVHVLGPVSKFTPEYNCDDPFSVRLKNESVAADSFNWNIIIGNDTIQSDLDSFDFAFPGSGDYVVELYTENFMTGCDYTQTDTILIREPASTFTTDTRNGCLPFNLQIQDSSADAVSWNYYAPGANSEFDTLQEPLFIYSTPGVYPGPKLVVTDINGCKDSLVLDSVFVNQLEAIPMYDEYICIPENVLLEDRSISQFAEVNSWEWVVGDNVHQSNDQNTSFFLDSAEPLDLQFIVGDTWGCVDTFILEDAITPIENFLDFEFDTLSCTQDFVQFKNLSTGQEIIKYEWDFGDGNISGAKSPKHNYTQEGTYTVCMTIIERQGCERTICKENIIEIRDPIAAFVADTTSIDCPPLLVNFTNNSSYTDNYIWDFGDNSGVSLEKDPSKVYTNTGLFDVMLIAKQGAICADTLLIEDYIDIQGPAGDFSFTADKSCLPLGVQFIGDSDSDYNYTWDFGNGDVLSSGNNSSTDTVNYEYTQTGTFVPKLILQNDSGCFRTFSGDPIAVNDISLAFEKETYCGPTQNIQVSNNSVGSESPDYTWTVNQGSSIFNSNDENLSLNLSDMGVYAVTLKAELENCVDSITVPDAITIASIPNVSFVIPENGICQFAEVSPMHNSTNAFGEITEFAWDFGDGGTSNEENPTHIYAVNEFHTITLVATTEYGCSNEVNENTDILEAAELSISPLDPFCRGDEAQIEVSVNNALAGSVIEWQTSTDLSCEDCLNPIVTPSNSGYYYINYIQDNGCIQSDSVFAEYYDIDGPELILATDNLICEGDTTLVSISNFNSDFSYTWSSDPIFSEVADDNSSLLVFPDSSIDVLVEVTNEEGCKQQNTSTVAIETFTADVLTEDKVYCVDQDIQLNVEIGNDPIWSGPGISCTNCDSPFVTVENEEQDFMVTVLSDNGCPFSDTLSIRGIPRDFVDAGEDRSICLGEQIRLDGSVLGEATWNESIYIDDIYDPKSIITPIQNSTFILRSSIGECIDADSVFIEVVQNVDIVAQGDTICFSEIGILTVEGNAFDYEWTDLRTNEKLENATIHELSPEETTEYMVVGNRSTCIPDTQYTEIKVYDQIIVEHEELFTVYPNQETQIILNSNGIYEYEWMPRDGLSCWDCPEPIFQIEENTEFTLTVTDPLSGCTAESRLFARYEPECTDKAYFLPNIFSPNEDGKNDEALIFAENPSEFIRLTIFDRWGEQMFTSEELEEGWDGLFRGEKAISGVYVMKIDAICETTGDPYTFYGDITLIR